jgi:hypothetical protein
VQYFFAVQRVGTLPCAVLDFAMQGFVAVRYFQTLSCEVSLPCVQLAAHGKKIFVMQWRTAMIGCTAMLFFPVVGAPYLLCFLESTWFF